MYDAILQSSARPFRATPDARFYFPHDSIESALQKVTRAIRRAEGPVMVLGAAGLGKSLLGELAANELRDEFDVVKLHSARLCSRKALLQNILFELQLPYRNLSEGELRLSILDRLEPNPQNAPGGVFIVVDEAHTLPTKLLEELRLITNFTRDGAPRARLLLIGGMQLEDALSEPYMESFNQRLAARCYLAPMTRAQTAQYVEHQIAAAGYDTKKFIDDDAIQAVCAASEGVPRLANQIMDHALVLANTVQQSPITVQLIEEAWADLQQLPAPWKSSADVQAEAVNEVEFGALEEEDPEFSSFEIAASPELTSAIDEQLNSEQSDGPAPAISPVESTSEIDLSSFPSEESVEDGESIKLTYGEALVNQDSQQVVGNEFAETWAADEESDNGELEIAINVDDTTADLRTAPESEYIELSTEAVDETTPELELGLRGYALGEEAVESEENESAEPASVPETNFFSAFAPIEIELSSEEDLSAVDIVEDRIATEGDSTVEPAQVTENGIDSASTESPATTEFDANNLFPTGRHGSGIEHVETNQGAGSDFFGERPTDEKLIAIEDEQLQYDSMGVWENDPPIDQQIVITPESQNAFAVFDTSESTEDVVEQTDSPAAFQSDEQPSQTAEFDAVAEIQFSEPGYQQLSEPVDQQLAQGPVQSETFEPEGSPENDVEIIEQQVVAQSPIDMTQLDASTINVGAGEPDRVEVIEESQQAIASVESEELKQFQEDLVEDHLKRIQEFSENVQQSPSNGTVEEVLSDSSLQESIIPELQNASAWIVDVNAIDSDKEALIQGEIEETVSQLNFSAFSVEPYSVEQLAPSASPSKIEEPEIPEAAGTEEVVQSTDLDGTEDFDDDRDLLIVEEDMAPNSRMSDSQKKTRTTPYSQLFAKLRQ